MVTLNYFSSMASPVVEFTDSGKKSGVKGKARHFPVGFS
jgi:hypothetical protein